MNHELHEKPEPRVLFKPFVLSWFKIEEFRYGKDEDAYTKFYG